MSCFQFEPACAPPTLRWFYTRMHTLQPLPMLRTEASFSITHLHFVAGHNLHPRRKKFVGFPNESLVLRASFWLSPFITPLKNTGRIWLCNKAPACHMHMLMFIAGRYNKLNWTGGAELLAVWVYATFIEYKSHTATSPRTMSRSFWANVILTADWGGIPTLFCMQGCFFYSFPD